MDDAREGVEAQKVRRSGSPPLPKLFARTDPLGLSFILLSTLTRYYFDDETNPTTQKNHQEIDTVLMSEMSPDEEEAVQAEFAQLQEELGIKEVCLDSSCLPQTADTVL